MRVKPAIRVSVIGGVNNPGFYYIDQNSSLWEVLKIAGGTTFEDGLKDMTWERDRDEINDNLVPYWKKEHRCVPWAFAPAIKYIHPLNMKHSGHFLDKAYCQSCRLPLRLIYCITSIKEILYILSHSEDNVNAIARLYLIKLITIYIIFCQYSL